MREQSARSGAFKGPPTVRTQRTAAIGTVNKNARSRKCPKGEHRISAAAQDPHRSPLPKSSPLHLHRIPAAVTVQGSVANALQELENILTSYNGQDNKQFHIQLEPENLGKLSISLFMGRDGLTARIGTQSAEVQGVLAGQVNQLISKLDSSGIQVQRMDVFCSDSGQQQNPDFSNGGSPRQQYNRRTGLLSRKTEPEKLKHADSICSLKTAAVR